MARDTFIDVRCLTDLKIQLERASVEVQVELEKETAKIGEELAELSKTAADKHSKSISPTIEAEPAPGGAFAVKAGAPGKPLARLYEKGNKGGRGGQYFKHPVFKRDGNAPWVEQKRYPFIKPTFNKARPMFAKQLAAAAERGLHQELKGGPK